MNFAASLAVSLVSWKQMTLGEWPSRQPKIHVRMFSFARVLVFHVTILTCGQWRVCRLGFSCGGSMLESLEDDLLRFRL